MIGAQLVTDVALAEAHRLGGADETIVLVTDRVDASLRWANNTMTTLMEYPIGVYDGRGNPA